jgi:hypothetical protein
LKNRTKSSTNPCARKQKADLLLITHGETYNLLGVDDLHFIHKNLYKEKKEQAVDAGKIRSETYMQNSENYLEF